MIDLVPLRVVSGYDELKNALRDRAAELDFSRADLDAVSGLPDGYSAKVLSPRSVTGARKPPKTFGLLSLGVLLEGLGLRLIVAEDPVATERAKTLAHGRDGRPDPAVSARKRAARQARPAAPDSEQAA